MSSPKGIQHLEAFGIFLCGIVTCAMIIGPLLASLELVPATGSTTAMSYESMVTIMLAVATLVVGIVLPLAAVFAFVLLRHDVRNKAEDVIKSEIKEGRFQKQVDDTVRPLLANAETVMYARFEEMIEQARKSVSRPSKIDWGVEENEYGESTTTKRGKKK